MVIVEPTYNSVAVGVETARLAAELGIARRLLVINRVTGPEDLDRVGALVAGLGGPSFESVHALPFDPGLQTTEPSVDGALAGGPLRTAVAHLADHLGVMV